MIITSLPTVVLIKTKSNLSKRNWFVLRVGRELADWI